MSSHVSLRSVRILFFVTCASVDILGQMQHVKFCDMLSKLVVEETEDVLVRHEVFQIYYIHFTRMMKYSPNCILGC